MFLSTNPMCTRIVSRTWKKDSYLNRIVEGWIIDGKSITKRIQHSEVWKNRFQRHVKQSKFTKVKVRCIKSMSSANHRFDSHSKPFARGVIFFDAYLTTAQSIYDERKNSEAGKDAAAWLRTVDEEACVQFAMLADAGFENLNLIRFLDDEIFDKSQVSDQLASFMSRTIYLFGPNRGSLKAGFAELMMETLQRPKTIFVDNGHRVLGGPGKVTEGILKRCFQRMWNFVTTVETLILQH